jgi:hypothetical protein
MVDKVFVVQNINALLYQRLRIIHIKIHVGYTLIISIIKHCMGSNNTTKTKEE